MCGPLLPLVWVGKVICRLVECSVVRNVGEHSIPGTASPETRQKSDG